MRAPIIHRMLVIGRRLAIAVALVLLAGIAVELARIYIMLHRWHPIAAYAYLGAITLGASVGLFWLWVWAGSAHLLDPPDMPADGARSHRDLMACNRFLAARLRRMGGNALLNEEQQHHVRQAAYHIDEILAHHPLNDDLQRSLQRTIGETLTPAHTVLRQRADAYARERMRAVVNDVIQPAIPTHVILTIHAYQLVMISRIVDIYLPGAGLREYARVIRDVTDVVANGRFLRLGQVLFTGVSSNSTPLGRAAKLLGQAMTSVWLTRVVSQAAILRCEDLRAWSAPRAIAELDACILDLLADSKECILREVLPVLKQVIRHNAPPDVADAAGFSSGVIDGLTRAIDAAVRAHKAQPPEQAVAAVRKTLADEGESEPPLSQEMRAEPGRRRRRRRRESGIARVLFVFGQRLRYTLRPPR